MLLGKPTGRIELTNEIEEQQYLTGPIDCHEYQFNTIDPNQTYLEPALYPYNYGIPMVSLSTYENTGAEWAGPDWDAQPAKRPTHLRANSPSRLSVGSDPSSPALSAKSSPGMYDFTDTFNGMGISHERDTPRQDLYLGYNLDTEQAYTGAGVSVCENYGQGGRHDPYYLPVDTDYHGRARGNSAPPPIHPNGGHVPPFPLHPSHNHPNLNASHPDLLPIQYDGHHYLERANGGAIPAIVKSIVATENIKKAAAIRRTQAAIFLCPEPGCETTFTTNFKLQSHLKAHKGVKDFACTIPGCRKAFTRKSDLRRHVSQTQHPGTQFQ